MMKGAFLELISLKLICDPEGDVRRIFSGNKKESPRKSRTFQTSYVECKLPTENPVYIQLFILVSFKHSTFLPTRLVINGKGFLCKLFKYILNIMIVPFIVIGGTEEESWLCRKEFVCETVVGEYALASVDNVKASFLIHEGEILVDHQSLIFKVCEQ